MAKICKVKLVRSPIGRPANQREIVRSLGLRKLNSTNELPDNEAVRGMVNKIRHLVQVTE